MFKKKFFLLTLIVVSILLTLSLVAYENGRKGIPKLNVTYNGNKLNVGKGSYRWKSNGKESIFTVKSYASVISKFLPGARITPNSNLELMFDYEPETITITGGYTEDNAPVIKNNIINIPKKSGTQIYFLDCKWKEGTVTYVVVVEIQE